VTFNPRLQPDGSRLFLICQTGLQSCYSDGSSNFPIDGWSACRGGSLTTPVGTLNTSQIRGNPTILIVNPFIYWPGVASPWKDSDEISINRVEYSVIPTITGRATSININSPYNIGGWGYTSAPGSSNPNNSAVFGGEASNLVAFQRQRDQTSGWPVLYGPFNSIAVDASHPGRWTAVDLVQLVLEPYISNGNSFQWRPTTVGHALALCYSYFDTGPGNNVYGRWQWRDNSGNWYWDCGCLNGSWNGTPYYLPATLARNANNSPSTMTAPDLSSTGQISAKFLNTKLTQWAFSTVAQVWVEVASSVNPSQGTVSTNWNAQAGDW
jgi:hypothetical protein